MPTGAPPFYFDGPETLAEQRLPTRQELDRSAPQHPVCILAASGYWAKPSYTALNSLALQLNGIDRNTVPSVPGVEIIKDLAGEPTGTIVDHNYREIAQMALLPAVPRFSAQDRLDGIRRALEIYHASGTTSIYEGHGCSPEVVAIYRKLRENNDLTMRTGLVVSPPWQGAADAEMYMRDWLSYAQGAGLGDPMLRVSGVFISFDGAKKAPAFDAGKIRDTGYWSHLRHTNDAEEFEALCMLAARHNRRVHCVASGSRVFDAVAIWERIAERFDIRSQRWVLEHVSTTNAECLARLKALGVGVTLIPNHHLWKNGQSFLNLSEEEQNSAVPAKQLHEAGIPVSAGTDNSPPNPLSTMRTIMKRVERTTGRVVGPEGRTTAEVALRILTSAGAWLTFEERAKGCLLPGFYADCAVLSDDPLTVPPDELEQLTCLATVVGGAFVHRTRQ
jgi:predicted amidohydrolase YtcJ